MSDKATRAFDPGHVALTSTDELDALIQRLIHLSAEMANYYEDIENEHAETMMSAVDSIIEYKWDKMDDDDAN